MKTWLNERQRALLSDKLMDLANLAMAALVFGQVLSGAELNLQLVGAGLALYLALLIQSTNMLRR